MTKLVSESIMVLRVVKHFVAAGVDNLKVLNRNLISIALKKSRP